MNDSHVGISIYPNGRGHYALQHPDGTVLTAGTSVTFQLSGQTITGQILWSARGDYVQCADQSTCGLCPGMQVTLPPMDEERETPRSAQVPHRIAWTTSSQALLVERYLTLAQAEPSRSLCAIGEQIAEEQHWDRQRTRSKLYQLRETLARELSRRQQAREQRLALETQPPLELVSGSVLWTVRIAPFERVKTWLLDYPYGTFPLQMPQRCTYEGDLYRLEQVWTSQLYMSHLGFALAQMQHEDDQAEDQDLFQAQKGLTHV